ncbi:DoxX family protein [Actinomadura atramentaria]|uniref:DoxX family protein n=1 Tax=Actinomadura atramentaria TaxID=1990 RepID=UPI0003A1D59A|nr:DoxX family protein [Actinomadura atramentaria]
MRPITALARPFVAAPFLVAGLEALRNPRQRAEQNGPALANIAENLDWLPTKDPVALVRAEGALSLGTGALLLTGKMRRLTSLLLAAQLVPALATEHRYWTEDDPERRASERSHLMKNAGLFGALLMIASEPHRTAKAAALKHQLKAQAKVASERQSAQLKAARREAARQVAEARRRARPTGGRAAGALGAKAAKLSGRAGKAGNKASWKAGKAAGKARGATAAVGKPVGKVMAMAGR